MDIGTIDPEVIRQATEFLTPKEIVKACLDNKFVNSALCENNGFWEYLFRRDFSEYVESDNYKRDYQEAANNIPSFSNKYEATHGLEKAIRKPVTGLVAALAAEAGQNHLVKKFLFLGLMDDRAMPWAAAAGHIDTVRLLLENGANEYNDSLVNAASEGHIDIVQLMLDRGANDYDEAIGEAKNQDIIDLINIYKQGKTKL